MHALGGKFFIVKYLLLYAFLSFAIVEACWILWHGHQRPICLLLILGMGVMLCIWSFYWSLDCLGRAIGCSCFIFIWICWDWLKLCSSFTVRCLQPCFHLSIHSSSYLYLKSILVFPTSYLAHWWPMKRGFIWCFLYLFFCFVSMVSFLLLSSPIIGNFYGMHEYVPQWLMMSEWLLGGFGILICYMRLVIKISGYFAEISVCWYIWIWYFQPKYRWSTQRVD